MRAWWIFGLVWLTAAPARAADEPGWAAGVKPGWVGAFATGFLGDGLRFNNPYRLSTVLGSDARSLSRTATYAEIGAAVALGDPASLAYGLALRASFALEGVEQAVLTPSVLILRRWQRWGVYGRAGIATVLTPDATWGGEGAAGALWFALAGVALAAEVVGDLFYGAGTAEVATPAYPVLSGQAGLWLSLEAMP
ncbi:MAG TPA: hypothetical protein VKU41_23840 [Polyangiaceae bacterium]|nr:hypothetical protein [Polyangiaceae bacterium]